MADKDDKTRKSAKPPSRNVKRKSLLGPSLQPPAPDLIGKRLRGYYDEIANQPVPDRFLRLLDQLESAARPKKAD
jgi:Anti-sigma factor NepR